MNSVTRITPRCAALSAVLFVMAGCSSNSDSGGAAGDTNGGAPSGSAGAVAGTSSTAGTASSMAGASSTGGASTTPGSGGASSGGTGSPAAGATGAGAGFGGTASVNGGAAGTSPAGGRAGAGGNGAGGRAGAGGNVAGGGAAGGAAGSLGGAAGSAGAGGCTPNTACMPTAPNTGDIYADCVARVNQFRACMCLPPLERWNDGEACANQDASYDQMNQSMGAHAAFKAKICAAGNAQDECPGWRSDTQVVSGCLQQMFDEGPPPMNPCTDTCYEQHGHFINMTNTRYTMVACGYYTGSDGKVWAVQNFK